MYAGELFPHSSFSMATDDLDGMRAHLNKSLFRELTLSVLRPVSTCTCMERKEVKHIFSSPFGNNRIDYERKVDIKSVYSYASLMFIVLDASTMSTKKLITIFLCFSYSSAIAFLQGGSRSSRELGQLRGLSPVVMRP